MTRKFAKLITGVQFIDVEVDARTQKVRMTAAKRKRIARLCKLYLATFGNLYRGDMTNECTLQPLH